MLLSVLSVLGVAMLGGAIAAKLSVLVAIAVIGLVVVGVANVIAMVREMRNTLAN